MNLQPTLKEFFTMTDTALKQQIQVAREKADQASRILREEIERSTAMTPILQQKLSQIEMQFSELIETAIQAFIPEFPDFAESIMADEVLEETETLAEESASETEA